MRIGRPGPAGGEINKLPWGSLEREKSEQTESFCRPHDWILSLHFAGCLWELTNDSVAGGRVSLLSRWKGDRQWEQERREWIADRSSSAPLAPQCGQCRWGMLHWQDSASSEGTTWWCGHSNQLFSALQLSQQKRSCCSYWGDWTYPSHPPYHSTHRYFLLLLKAWVVFSWYH